MPVIYNLTDNPFRRNFWTIENMKADPRTIAKIKQWEEDRAKAKEVYCNLCERSVGGEKKFNIILFVILLLLFGVGAVIYLAYYLFLQAKKCPICKNKLE